MIKTLTTILVTMVILATLLTGGTPQPRMIPFTNVPVERIVTQVPDYWIPVAFAPPDAFLLFVYVDKLDSGKGTYLKAVMILENETKYRLIGGVSLTKDLLKENIDDVIIVAIRE